MVYIGLDEKHISANLALHHQILQQEPFGEGNSIFISISPAWDKSRAPVGKRALTISTHTRYESWWDLCRNHPDEYNDRKNAYLDRILSLAERAVPGIAQHTDLIMPGTPVTFQRYTHRSWGWVGGFPQTNLFQTWGPRLAPGLWMVGDTIFPGQSIPAVMMGGHRVANQIKSETDRSRRFFIRQASYPARMARD